VTLGLDLDARKGLLGKGAILATTAKPDRNSPVTRGKWVMTNILGVPPPDPPQDVPPLPARANDARGNAVDPSMRTKMLDHRKAGPACVNCHRLMDPIGFTLENFDAIALWRTTDAGSRIDATGKFPDGITFNGPAGLELGTEKGSTPNQLGRVEFDLGVIAGDRSINWIKSIPGVGGGTGGAGGAAGAGGTGGAVDAGRDAGRG